MGSNFLPLTELAWKALSLTKHPLRREPLVTSGLASRTMLSGLGALFRVSLGSGTFMPGDSLTRCKHCLDIV